jgi:hypothetical protein
LAEFESFPDSALISQQMLGAIRRRSVTTLQAERKRGAGVPYIKDGKSVRYRKADILAWIAQQVSRP